LEQKNQEQQRSMKAFNDQMAKMQQDKRDEDEKNARLREQKDRELEATKANLNNQIQTLTNNFNNQQTKYEGIVSDLRGEQQKLLK
jgi:hypothetical protein